MHELMRIITIQSFNFVIIHAYLQIYRYDTTPKTKVKRSIRVTNYTHKIMQFDEAQPDSKQYGTHMRDQQAIASLELTR